MTREREPTDKERKLPLIERPPETLSAAEKRLLQDRAATEAKYSRRITSTPATETAISENPNLKKDVDEARLKTILKDRETITKVETTTTERGTQDITKIYDAATNQLIATKTQTSLNIFVDSSGKRTSPPIQMLRGGGGNTFVARAEENKPPQQPAPIIDILSKKTTQAQKTGGEALVISSILDSSKYTQNFAPTQTNEGTTNQRPPPFFLNENTEEKKINSLLNNIYRDTKKIGGTISPKYDSLDVKFKETNKENFGFRTDEIKFSVAPTTMPYEVKTASILATSDATTKLKIEYLTYNVFKQTGNKAKQVISNVATPVGGLGTLAVLGLGAAAPPVALYVAGGFIATSIFKDTQKAVQISKERYVTPSYVIEAAASPISTATTAASFIITYKAINKALFEPKTINVDATAYKDAFKNWNSRPINQLDLNILKSITKNGIVDIPPTAITQKVLLAGKTYEYKAIPSQKGLFKNILEVKKTQEDLSIIEKNWLGVGFPDAGVSTTKFLFPENTQFKILGTIQDGQIVPFTGAKAASQTINKLFQSKKGQITSPQDSGTFAAFENAFNKIQAINWDSLKIQTPKDGSAAAALFASSYFPQEKIRQEQATIRPSFDYSVSFDLNNKFQTSTRQINVARQNIETINLNENFGKTQIQNDFISRGKTQSDIFAGTGANTQADSITTTQADTIANTQADSITTTQADTFAQTTATSAFTPAIISNIGFGFKTPPLIPIVPINLNFGFGRGKSDFLKPQQTKGFDVFVRRGGKFKQINLSPLDKSTAIKKGIINVTNTAAATFKIKPAQQTAIKTTDFKNYDNLIFLKQFTKRTEKDKEIYIQKRKYRISTWGEKQEITFKKQGKKIKNV